MELLARLDLHSTNAFFSTFFRLPDFFWRGFLSSSLTSAQLIAFALLTFALAPFSIQLALVRHLITHPAGPYLIRHYLGEPLTCAQKLLCLEFAVASQCQGHTAARACSYMVKK